MTVHRSARTHDPSIRRPTSIGDASAAGDLVPVALEEAAIADQPGAGDVEVGGHGGLPGTNARFS